jgi:hypothetical protein
MFCRITIATSAARARDIVEVIKPVLDLNDIRIDIALGCDSPAQCGQLTRRIQEGLQQASIDPKEFVFKPDKGQSASVEISFISSSAEHHQSEDRGEYPPEMMDLVRKTQMPSAISEGDFKIRLNASDVLERNGRSFAALTWEIAEGQLQRSVFEDQVMIFPPNDRSRYFAAALGVAEDTIAQRLAALRGSVVLVRRRRNVLPDGTEKMVNHYYPLPRR